MSGTLAAGSGGTWRGPARLWAAVAPNLAFALRLTAAVCLALYVSFYLQVDNPGWAGTSAAITCQPVLGAALRKGRFRFIGTLLGAVFVVVLTACFPQERAAFLGGVILWAGLCAFIGSWIGGAASYAALLAGYTTAIIASSSINAPDNAFILALNRATEITIGIACATVVLGATDRGGARQSLSAALRAVRHDIREGLFATLLRAGAPAADGSDDTQTRRRALIRQTAGLDPLIDNAIGESAALRYRRPALMAAMNGLFAAISGWRVVNLHLARLPAEAREQAAARVRAIWPGERLSGAAERDALFAAGRRLIWLPAGTPTERLVADQTAAALRGLARAANGQALADDTGAARRATPPPTARAPDWLPAAVNALRVIFAVSVAAWFWIATAWPSGLLFVTFVTVSSMLLGPLNERSAGAALAFAFGSAVAAVVAGVIEFAVLPHMSSYAGFCAALSLGLIPVGMLQASLRWGLYFTPATANFVPILSPTNQITYDTQSFYNTAIAITAGCLGTAVVMWLLPPVSPAHRAARLAQATLRDLRRIAAGRWQPAPQLWQARLDNRLAQLPDQAPLVEGARLLTAMLVGAQVLRLRRVAARYGLERELATATLPLARGDVAGASRACQALDDRLAAVPAHEPGGFTRMRARAALREIVEALAAHGDYFGGAA